MNTFDPESSSRTGAFPEGFRLSMHAGFPTNHKLLKIALPHGIGEGSDHTVGDIGPLDRPPSVADVLAITFDSQDLDLSVTDLKVAADKLNELDLVRDYTSLTLARMMGHILLQVKERLPHGEFTDWIKTNCNFSVTTARNHMRIAEHWDSLPELLSLEGQHVADLPIRTVLKALARPKQERESNDLLDLDADEESPRDEHSQLEGVDVIDLCAESTDVTGTEASSEPQAPWRDVAGDRFAIGMNSDESVRCPVLSSRNQYHSPNVATEIESPERSSDRGSDLVTLDRHGDSSAEVSPAVGAEDREWQVETDEDLDDAMWLESLPLHSVLTDPKTFDTKALLWRRLRPIRDRLAEVAQLGPDHYQAGLAMRSTTRILPTLVRFLDVPHPRRWLPCDPCGGKGRKDTSLLLPCETCDGAGFKVPRSNDSRRSSESQVETSDGPFPITAA